MTGRCLLAAAALAGSLAASAAERPVEIPNQTFTLPNGLTVIVHEDRKAPIVAVNIWYHVGAKDEPRGKSGFAHLFEHLMFQGTEHFNDEYFGPMELVGATDLNGTTDFDRTNYFQNVPVTALDMALWMESERMGHLLGVIDQARLDEQRGVVQNEKRQSENQPYGRVWDQLFTASFPTGHPYDHLPIGSMEDLNAASLDDVKAWFAKYYGASNAVLVLAGDIDLATAKQKVEKYFGHIPGGPPLARRKQFIAAREDSRRDVMHDRIAQTRIYRSWNTPGAGTADLDYLSIAAQVLGGGKTSRLYERLAYREQSVDSISAFGFGLELAGLFAVQADVKNGVDPAKVEAAIAEELARLLKDGPTADELERAKTQVRAGFVRGVERIGGFGGKADVLAECQVYLGDPDCYRTTLDRVEAATAAQVRDAARRWLAQGDYTLAVVPYGDRTNAEASAIDRKAGIPQVEQFPDVDFPKLQRAKLKNGIEVVLAERHAVPIVNVELMFDAGYAADQGAALGTSSFTMQMLDEGAGELDALEISRRAQSLGAQLFMGSGVDYSNAGVSALADKLEESLDLLALLVREPGFPQFEIDRVKKQWLAGIAREKTQPTSIALRVLPPLLYGEGHPYAMPFSGTGTEASIGRLTREDLVRYHQRFVRPDNVRILAVGDTTMAALLPALEHRFGNWRAEGAPPAKSVAPVELPAAPRVYLVDQPGAQQSTIIAGVLAPSPKAPNHLELGTADSILGGTFTSRLNLNLREDKHWSYGAGSFFGGSVGQRPWIVYAPVQTDKTAESLTEMRREIDEYVGERLATEAELDKIKSNDVRSLPGQFETASAVLGAMRSIELYERPDDYVTTLKDRTEAQSLANVHAAARELVRPQALTWVVVGDLKTIEAPVRALKLGEVKVVDADGKVLR
ncbi:MAG TPA: pitrilysin family protein [Xanthomonadales bacterium]|nr:pitrilysin family protein [Xanthomonadales bacterium]